MPRSLAKTRSRSASTIDATRRQVHRRVAVRVAVRCARSTRAASEALLAPPKQPTRPAPRRTAMSTHPLLVAARAPVSSAEATRAAGAPTCVTCRRRRTGPMARRSGSSCAGCATASGSATPSTRARAVDAGPGSRQRVVAIPRAARRWCGRRVGRSYPQASRGRSPVSQRMESNRAGHAQRHRLPAPWSRPARARHRARRRPRCACRSPGRL
jgi:hypothetical protein